MLPSVLVGTPPSAGALPTVAVSPTALPAAALFSQAIAAQGRVTPAVPVTPTPETPAPETPSPVATTPAPHERRGPRSAAARDEEPPAVASPVAAVVPAAVPAPLVAVRWPLAAPGTTTPAPATGVADRPARTLSAPAVDAPAPATSAPPPGSVQPATLPFTLTPLPAAVTPAALTPPPPLPPVAPQLEAPLADVLHRARVQAGETVRLDVVLRPEGLGRVELGAVLVDGRLEVQLRCDSADGETAVRAAVEGLRAGLGAAAGVPSQVAVHRTPETVPAAPVTAGAGTDVTGGGGGRASSAPSSSPDRTDAPDSRTEVLGATAEPQRARGHATSDLDLFL